MKTTVDITDSLFEEVRKLASKEGTTVRAFIEEGLRKILAEHNHRKTFRLRKATFKGKGLHPDVSLGSWEKIRGMIYEGQGG